MSGPQAPLVAPSSQSEDVLDVEQVALQEAPLPPPVNRVMDPGWLTRPQFQLMLFYGFIRSLMLMYCNLQVFQTLRRQLQLLRLQMRLTDWTCPFHPST